MQLNPREKGVIPKSCGGTGCTVAVARREICGGTVAVVEEAGCISASASQSFLSFPHNLHFCRNFSTQFFVLYKCRKNTANYANYHWNIFNLKNKYQAKFSIGNYGVIFLGNSKECTQLGLAARNLHDIFVRRYVLYSNPSPVGIST